MSAFDPDTPLIDRLIPAMERVFPDQVDKSRAGNGEQEAGYILHHDADADRYTVGWYCDGGNMGHPVFSWRASDTRTTRAICHAVVYRKTPAADIKKLIKFKHIEWHI